MPAHILFMVVLFDTKSKYKKRCVRSETLQEIYKLSINLH